MRFSRFYTLRTPQGALKIDSYRTPHFVGHASSRSMLPTNEDRYSLGFYELPLAREMRPVFSASVFDGHGGDASAEFLARALPSYVMKPDLNERATRREFGRRFGGYWRNAALQAAADPVVGDPASSSSSSSSSSVGTSGTSDADGGSGVSELIARLSPAFLRADLDLLASDELTGSTCTAAYIYTVDPQRVYWEAGAAAELVVAQIGDSRAIIADRRGNCVRLTAVHHANSAHESDRLARFRDAFTSTPQGQQLFLQYVNTRSFGDHQGKPFGISAEPEVTQRRLEGDEAFVVIVSDGVIDRASDQEVCDLVIRQAADGGALRGTPQRAAEQVVSYVQMLRTQDNATALVIRLGGWGDWEGWTDRSEGLREEKLRMALRRRED